MIDERIYEALNATGYPVTQRPVAGTAPVYLTWDMTLGTADGFSSNVSRRVTHIITVDIFSREPDIGTVFGSVVLELKRRGITATYWGPRDYEQNTRWYHLPITCHADEVYEIGG